MEDKPLKERMNKRVSSGPLRLHSEEGQLFVTGFGLWIPVANKEEGLRMIAELEDQGFRLCF
jgi:hypothetical protein